MGVGLKEEQGVLLSDLELDSVTSGPGVYLIREQDGTALYASETHQLAARLKRTFDANGPRSQWSQRSQELHIFTHSVASVSDYPFARQSLLLKWHKPEWNSVRELAI